MPVSPTPLKDGFVLTMLAESAIHPGTGQSTGVVDLPVAREGATGWPHLPESGLKGALSQWWKEKTGEDHRKPVPAGAQRTDAHYLFGDSDEAAGELVISTGRLLALPLRRLDGPYCWTTTPALLERLARDAERLARDAEQGKPLKPPAITAAQVEWGLGEPKLKCDAPADGTIFLEEFAFTPEPCEWTTTQTGALVKRLVDEQLATRLIRQLVLMRDADFAWYAETGLPVAARNVLDESKISKNLWYEETLPADTLLYALILRRTGGSGTPAAERFETFKKKLRDARFLQTGGNETVGQGWMRLAIVDAI